MIPNFSTRCASDAEPRCSSRRLVQRPGRDRLHTRTGGAQKYEIDVVAVVESELVEDAMLSLEHVRVRDTQFIQPSGATESRRRATYVTLKGAPVARRALSTAPLGFVVFPTHIENVGEAYDDLQFRLDFNLRRLKSVLH